MLGLIRAAKLITFALVVGFIGIQPGESPDFAMPAAVPGVPVSGGDDVPPPGDDTFVPPPVEDGAPIPDNPIDGAPVPVPTGNPDVPGLTCNRDGNGGATDVGVSASEIKLASTMVQSGPGKSFLGDSPIGMQAVVNKINHAGGVCGRLLRLELVDDGWDASRGLGYIKNFIAQGAFALPVMPSSEGLTAAIEAGVISKAGIPVIGTDGMLKQQYEDPWVWPVASATVSTMRVIAKQAYAQGARKFGIVWDTRYRFGKEGEEAFVKYVKTLPGASVKSNQGILPSRASYSSEIQSFNSQCNNACDAVVLLLEPQTALTWINGRPQMGTKVTSAAQTLFQESFARNCGEKCAGMLVWTGYNPPIENFQSMPGVKQYRDDVTALQPTVDYTNQFLQGAYLGMSIFVEALKAVGPNLTRARLAQVMNSTTFRNDIALKLRWTTANRFANCTAQAFRIRTADGSFSGFGYAQTGFIKDPNC